MFKNKSLLITGGTGSFGKAFLKHIIKKYKTFKRIVIFSRDEFKQSELTKIFPTKKHKFLDIIWVMLEIMIDLKEL